MTDEYDIAQESGTERTFINKKDGTIFQIQVPLHTSSITPATEDAVNQAADDIQRILDNNAILAVATPLNVYKKGYMVMILSPHPTPLPPTAGIREIFNGVTVGFSQMVFGKTPEESRETFKRDYHAKRWPQP